MRVRNRSLKDFECLHDRTRHPASPLPLLTFNTFPRGDWFETNYGPFLVSPLSTSKIPRFGLGDLICRAQSRRPQTPNCRQANGMAKSPAQICATLYFFG